MYFIPESIIINNLISLVSGFFYLYLIHKNQPKILKIHLYDLIIIHLITQWLIIYTHDNYDFLHINYDGQ